MAQNYIRIADGVNLKVYASVFTNDPNADTPALVVRNIPSGIQSIIQQPTTTSNVTSIDASTTSVTLLPANLSRRGAIIYNDPDGGAGAGLFVKFGTMASSTSFTVRLSPNSYYEIPFFYNGIVDGIWVAAEGTARITELLI